VDLTFLQTQPSFVDYKRQKCYNRTMRKIFSLLMIFLVFLFVLNMTVLARSGCCSYHNGVRADGCGCNDGTPLSSTCAPYYQCNSGGNINTAPAVQEIYIPPTNTPIPLPTWTPVPTYTPVPTNKPTPKSTKPTLSITTKKVTKQIVSKKKAIKKKTFWQWLFNR